MKRSADDESPESTEVKRAHTTEEKTAEGEEDAQYWLFVAVRDKVAGKDKKEDAEEELGTEDTDDDEEVTGEIEAMEWGDALNEGVIRDRIAALETIVGMSRHIYDRSDEGAGEIRMANDAVELQQQQEQFPSSATVGKEVVGMLVLKWPSRSSKTTEITQLFVEPEVRGVGAGRVLVEVAEEFSRDQCEATAVECFAVGGSSHFYSKVGFVRKHSADTDSRCEMLHDLLALLSAPTAACEK